MPARFTPFIIVICLTACSRGGSSQPAQQPAQPQAAPPASSAAPSPATAPASTAPAAPQAEPPAAAQPATPAPAGDTAPKPSAPAAPRLTAAGPAAEKAEPAKPEFREVTIPAGTPLHVRLTTPVASDTSKVEDRVRGTLVSPLTVDGVTAVPADTEVVGTVRSATRSGRVKGRASLSFQFERLMVRGESLAVHTATVSREAAADRGGDVKKGAIGGAAGAIVGGIVGGGKGAAIGAGVGGAGAVAATRGNEVRLAAGTTVQTTLREPLTVTVPR